MEKIFSMNSLRKYHIGVLVILIVAVAVGVVVPRLITPRYKVSSVISISPRYFQNSLLREFMSEVYDPTELKSQRQSLISEALDKKFLDQLSEKTGYVLEGESASQAAERRQKLLQSIEVISLQSSDYQISVTDSDSEKAMMLCESIVQNVLTVLKEKRTDALARLKTAIATQLQGMVPHQGTAPSADADVLKLQIAQLQNDIQTKEKIFSPQHPELREQRKTLANLQAQLTQVGSVVGAPQVELIEGKWSKDSDFTQKNIFEDLSRKYSYLNIVLMTEANSQPSYFSVVRSAEFPLSPIWPKKMLFLMWALLLGVLASVAYVAVGELWALRHADAELDFIAGKTPAMAPGKNKASVTTGLREDFIENSENHP